MAHVFEDLGTFPAFPWHFSEPTLHSSLLSIRKPGIRAPPDIIPAMARGWESKSVEQQQADAATVSAPKRERLTPQQVAAHRQREGLLLARKRVLQQLQAAQNPNHRQVLENALADLDARLLRLG